MKFRKKPVVIEATQWFKHGDHPAVEQDTDENRPIGALPIHDTYGLIRTLKELHIVAPGDWIITGVKGEYYPCKPDIFEQTYERVK